MILAGVLFILAVLAWGFPVAVGGLLVAVFAFRAGQYHRGLGHARGIYRSHVSAIRGRR
ncbi:hypothetical protein [Terrabacter terrigena]|uniref:DUF4133 domain-containing protein n=1 Tax=Terrabacter terrigena TaxID=574718 RepID=A0ABW3MZF0_9MICO